MEPIDKKDEIEPEVVPVDLQPQPPSKSASIHSVDAETDKKYETIQTIQMTDPSATANSNLKSTIDRPMSALNSSLNLLPTREILHQPERSGISVNTKLGIIQLTLSIFMSAFGGLLIARNASLAMLGSGIWSGIFAGIAGSLGLMNIKPLLNGFLACSLVSVATSTLALALTGIGLLRDYNFSQQDPELESAVFGACGLTFLLILHLFTSIFSVYYSALELCSNKEVGPPSNDMNYEKVQKYLKSLQNAGISSSDFNGYQNYINQAKLYRQKSMSSSHHRHEGAMHPHHYQMPIYATSASSGYMTGIHPQRMYTLPHSLHSNYYQDYFYMHDEAKTKTLKEQIRSEKRKELARDEANLNSYNFVDRDLADNFLKRIENVEKNQVNHPM